MYNIHKILRIEKTNHEPKTNLNHYSYNVEVTMPTSQKPQETVISNSKRKDLARYLQDITGNSHDVFCHVQLCISHVKASTLQLIEIYLGVKA